MKRNFERKETYKIMKKETIETLEKKTETKDSETRQVIMKSGKSILSTGKTQELEQFTSLDCISSDIITIVFTFFPYFFCGFLGELPFHKIKTGAIQILLPKPAIS